MKMNKFLILFSLLIQLTFLISLKGQNGLCFQFTDTLCLKANVVCIWHSSCVCPSLFCVVSNDNEKEIALSLFSGESHFPEESMPPLLTDRISKRLFVLMRNYLEDSLSSRFTWEQIRLSLEDEIHVDTIDRMNNYREELMKRRANPNTDQKLHDIIQNIMIEWHERISRMTDEELNIGNLHFEGNGKYNPQPFKNAPIDTVVCNGETYCIKESPFESWGILMEVQNECNFFWFDTAEMDFLQHYKFKKLTIFIPLKEKEFD